jgi:hypothetical protein
MSNEMSSEALDKEKKRISNKRSLQPISAFQRTNLFD